MLCLLYPVEFQNIMMRKMAAEQHKQTNVTALHSQTLHALIVSSSHTLKYPAACQHNNNIVMLTLLKVCFIHDSLN